MAKGDAVAAMEAFAALAAKRDAKRERSADPDELEDEERRKRAEPLLNKTAFERRKTTAVYKDDGSRGHHMGVGDLADGAGPSVHWLGDWLVVWRPGVRALYFFWEGAEGSAVAVTLLHCGTPRPPDE